MVKHFAEERLKTVQGSGPLFLFQRYIQIGYIQIGYKYLFLTMAKAAKKKYNRIKEVLADQGKTQTWLADEIGKEFVTVTRYVNNVRQPSLEILAQIAKVLRVSPKELIND
jgi:DNA-binding XRE family transcriptional regulator